MIAGQVALLAGGGLGAASVAARALARAGVEVRLAVREPRGVPAGALGQGRILHEIDDGAPPAAVCERVVRETGRLDVFLYTAAPAVVSPFSQLDSQAWSRGVLEPLEEVHRWLSAVMLQMRRQRYGTVVLIGPVGGAEPQDDRVAPATLDSALGGLAEGLAYVGLRWNARCYALRVGARAVDVGPDPDHSPLAVELEARLLEVISGRSSVGSGGVIDINAAMTLASGT